MKFTSQRRPSPAMVVAVIALSLGLAGSAVAAKGGLGKAQVRTVAGKEIAKRAPGLAVATAKSAETAKSADSAETATSADTAKLADVANAVAANAVTGAGIADGAVASADLANDSVNGPKVVDSSLTNLDLARDSVRSDEIAIDAVDSETIVSSSVGASELKNQRAYVSAGVTVPSGAARTTEVTCPRGTRLLSGGHAWTVDGLNSIIASAPDETTATGRWVVRGFVPTGSPTNGLFAWAVCLHGDE